MRAAAPPPRAPAGRGDGAPLLPRPLARRLRADRARRARVRDRSLSLRAGDGATSRPRTSSSRTWRRPRRHSRATSRRCPTASSPSLDLYAEHARRGAAPRGAGETAARSRSRPVAVARRCTGSWSRSPSRAAAAGCRRSTCSPSGPGRTGLVEDESLRGLHPMMGHRLHLWRLRDFDARAPALGRGHLRSSTASRATNPKDERLFALAEVRDLTPVRDEHGRVVGAAELEQMLVEALETIRGFQARRPLEPAPALEPRAALRVAGDRARAPTRSARSSRAWRRSTAGLGLEMLLRPRAPARGRTAASRDRVLRFFTPAGPRRRRRDRRPADPSRCSRSTRAPGGSSRRGGAGPLHPAEIVRLLAPAPRDAGPAARGRSSSTTSTTTGGSCPVDRPPATNPSGHRRRHDPQLHRALSRGHAARDPARRPDARARLARRARVPADHRRARPRRGARRAARVVRALRRRQDRDGQRHRERWTGSRPCCGGSCCSPRPAARSTSSSPASTSAPSPTGTPRRRC